MRRRLRLALDLGLFALALYVLRRVLSEYHYSDVLAAIQQLGGWPIAACLALSLLGYAALIGYDYLSLRPAGPAASAAPDVAPLLRQLRGGQQRPGGHPDRWWRALPPVQRPGPHPG